MISNVHYVELYINKQLMELESQESFNIRMNSVMFDPTKTSTTQAEYSFSFDIPSTPNNDKVLDYANNLSKINKFHARYPAEVYADGTLIFNGSLTIKKYNGSKKMYECNLVNIKINTLDEIFGDAVLTEVTNWMVDFNGCDTMNAVNENSNSKYWFPLVSYGAFIKDPSIIDTYGVHNTYTSKYVIDETNRWYIESFYPSLNVLEEMKKCFEWKGYTVGGTALFDPIIKNIYASTNLADGQSPDYNVGNPRFGKISMNIQWTGSTTLQGSGNEHWFSQNLKFPYFPVGSYGWDYVANMALEPKWNFDEVFINPLLKDGSVRLNDSSTMMIPDRQIIVIPADGFYKISLSANTQLTQTSNITANQYVCNWNDNITAMSMTAEDEVITFPPDYTISTPLEIQLVKNYDENLELIKGKYNLKVNDGHPDHETECNKGRYSNYTNTLSCFPHEAAGYSYMYTSPTKTDAIEDATTTFTDANIGYVYTDGYLHCYDPVVSDSFICGFTTMGNKNGGGCASFIKNGYSWSKSYADRTDSLYYQNGYQKVWLDSEWTARYEASNKNLNNLNNVPHASHTQYNNTCVSSVCGMVYLKKNDVLEVMAVRRGYYSGGTPVTYGVTANIDLTIEAASPNNIYTLQSQNYGWNSPTQFPTKLNLFAFTNKEKKISEWIKNVTDAFNLSLEMNGNNVDINVNKGIKKTLSNAISIDDRVNSADVTAEYISYPKEMSIMYQIDTEEHGFYESVPEAHINDADWKEWGDRGYTVIKLNDDSYETSTQNKQTQFSYTWYDNFDITYAKTTIPDGQTIPSVSIPVISKEEYMIDGFDYEEAMLNDGYALPQRFWFRDFKRHASPYYVNFELKNDWYFDQGHDVMYNRLTIYTPKNQMDGVNLSYKDTETSIVTEYFNIYPMLSSNYVKVDVFLNPEEYIQIKGGAMVNFDSDLYYTAEISAYDPSGFNTTQLKLIKKV